MSKIRQKRRSWWLMVCGFLWLTCQSLPSAWAGPAAAPGPGAQSYRSPVIILSGEFFEAMNKLAKSGEVVGDRQELFLEQIATAQRFLVKTNLTLIEQQEKIIRLLEELNRRGQGEKR
jgi:hypothetical protein